MALDVRHLSVQSSVTRGACGIEEMGVSMTKRKDLA
jgi:hypothetical protein